MADPRLGDAVRLFNAGEWYACHDGFEELWHETQAPCRKVLQGILQIAVAHLHLERGNRRGATVLLGEGLGRLQGAGDACFGLDLTLLRQRSRDRLLALQQEQDPDALPLPALSPAP
jgi:predicted metal-dependent hydrolase